jgi:hypothetical protein
LLEGKETDAKGKQNVVEGIVSRENPVYVDQEEIKILKVKQDSAVQKNCQNHFSLTPKGAGGFVHNSGEGEIDQNGDQNDGQITGGKVTVEPKGHNKQESLGKGIFFEMIQSEIPHQTQREKYQNKDIGIEEQTGSTPYCAKNGDISFIIINAEKLVKQAVLGVDYRKKSIYFCRCRQKSLSRIYVLFG